MNTPAATSTISVPAQRQAGSITFEKGVNSGYVPVGGVIIF